MTDTDNEYREPHGTAVIRMSNQDFAAWGIESAAYIKPVDADKDAPQPADRAAFSIHAADGRHLGFAENRALAFAAVLREGLEPVSVH